jgi:hypothetical protein
MIRFSASRFFGYRASRLSNQSAAARLSGFAALLCATLAVLFMSSIAQAAPAEHPCEQQATLVMTATVGAGQTQVITVPVAAADVAEFNVASDHPLTVTLVDPAGSVIDPSTLESNEQVQYDVIEPGEYEGIDS